MIGMEKIMHLVRTILWTGQVKGERPVSIIFVAPPGSGKTSVLEKFQTRTSHFLSDITSREIRNLLDKKPDLTHIVIGDFLSVFGHSRGTIKLSINLLSRLSGDAIKQAPWTGEEITPRRIGIITAIPPKDFDSREVRQHFQEGGFASRFIIARYDYRQITIDGIHDYIKDSKYREETNESIEMESAKLIINIGTPWGEKIMHLSSRIKNDPIGFRAHKYLRTIACAHARMSGRVEVNMDDYNALLDMCEFFTQQGKML